MIGAAPVSVFPFLSESNVAADATMKKDLSGSFEVGALAPHPLECV